jgi:hypothetical protein
MEEADSNLADSETVGHIKGQTESTDSGEI